MTIEENIKRIADNSEILVTAIEELLGKLNHIGCAVESVEAPKQEAPTPPPAPEATSAPTPPPMPETPTPPPVPTALTPEQLNEALVAASQRLGGAQKIFDLMKDKFAVASITDLDASKYQELLDAVGAL